MDCAKVCIFKHTDKVSLTGFMDGFKGHSLNSHVLVIIVHDLSDSSHERSLGEASDILLLLILLDLSECNSTRLVTSLDLLSFLLTAILDTTLGLAILPLLAAEVLLGVLLASHCS